ncbi:MAG TPA: hypothetical protein VF788_13455 [Pseudonocardiaceae bacterium]
MTLIEPGGYDTDWGGSSARRATPLPAYDPVRKQAAEQRAHRVASLGKPEATRQAILQVVDAERPPLRIFFGNGPLGIATGRLRVTAGDLARVEEGVRLGTGRGLAEHGRPELDLTVDSLPARRSLAGSAAASPRQRGRGRSRT